MSCLNPIQSKKLFAIQTVCCATEDISNSYWPKSKSHSLHMNTYGINTKSTYSMNKIFQRSSDLQNAYKNLHVDPSNRNSTELRYSRVMARTSSGNT